VPGTTQAHGANAGDTRGEVGMTTTPSDGSSRSSDPGRPWLAHYPPHIDWFAPIAEKPLFELLDHAVATYPNNICIDFLGKTYSYREIGELVKRVAKGLQGIGVTRGTKVGLFLPNSPYSVIFFFAILKAGGVVVNYNPLYAERELIHQIQDSDTDIFITLDLKALYDKVPPLLRQTRLAKVVICRLQDALPFPKNRLYPLVKRKDIATFPLDDQHVRFVDLIANDGRFALHPVDPPGDPAVLQYTGGTTGVPKGAMLSHANLYANAMQCEKWFPEGEPGGERVVGVLPLFHVFAMTVVMTYGIYGGAKLILLPRFEIVQLLETITKKKPTMMPGVPTLFTAINNYKNLQKYDLSSLKYCISGGAALPLEVKHNFERLSGCTLVEGYGLSETSPVATSNPFRGVNKAGSIGLPLPGTTIEIASIEHPTRLLPVGERGEVCISGPQVMIGYWKRPDATAQAIVDGRLHTGDIGYMDEDGYTFIVDRLKEMIIAGGYNIYPRNVEEAIYLHPAVTECAVVGLPDPYRGQTVKAYVRLTDGASLDAHGLLEFLKDKLSPIEMPKQIEFRGELPKSAIGKILKKELLAEEARRAEAGKASKAG
jgi:long-chain acyl-CoA synthetase